MELNYESIKHLIVKEEVIRQKVYCAFRVPESNKIVEATAELKKSIDLKDNAQRIVKEGVAHQIQYTMRDMIRKFIPGGPYMTHTAMRLTDAVITDRKNQVIYSRNEIEDAVVEAFRTVQAHFQFSEHKKSWEMSSEMPAFLKQLQDAPITNGYDREVLSRMLVEIAMADRNISNDEREFLESYLDPDKMTLDQAMIQPALSDHELNAVSSPAVKESMFMLCVAMVISDQEASDAEKSRLLHFAKTFLLDSYTVQRLVKSAKLYALECALPYIGIGYDQVFTFADKIKLDRGDAENFLIDYKKRKY